MSQNRLYYTTLRFTYTDRKRTRDYIDFRWIVWKFNVILFMLSGSKDQMNFSLSRTVLLLDSSNVYLSPESYWSGRVVEFVLKTGSL